MLAVTERARQLLKKKLRSHSADPETSLRLSEKEGQFGIVLDSESEGDQVVEHEGAKVLLVAPELAPMLEGITVDVQDTADGLKLAVTKEKKSNSKD